MAGPMAREGYSCKTRGGAVCGGRAHSSRVPYLQSIESSVGSVPWVVRCCSLVFLRSGRRRAISASSPATGSANSVLVAGYVSGAPGEGGWEGRIRGSLSLSLSVSLCLSIVSSLSVCQSVSLSSSLSLSLSLSLARPFTLDRSLLRARGSLPRISRQRCAQCQT